MDTGQEVKLLIEHYGITPQDWLGQNFLISTSGVNYILQAINPSPNKTYLEVGAGFLILTKAVASKARKVIAIEKDGRFQQFYKDCTLNNIEVIIGDALDLDFTAPGASEIFGNIPYYISSQILIKTGKCKNIERAVLLFQKEFADRILASPNSKKYGAITVLVDLYFDKKFIKTMPSSFFYPRPTISSTLVELTRREISQDINEERFLKLVRCSFSMRRKKLLNNLKEKYGEREVKEAIERLCLPPQVRAENLSIDKFIALYKALER